MVYLAITLIMIRYRATLLFAFDGGGIIGVIQVVHPYLLPD
jgi:hypothetical protein